MPAASHQGQQDSARNQLPEQAEGRQRTLELQVCKHDWLPGALGLTREDRSWTRGGHRLYIIFRPDSVLLVFGEEPTNFACAIWTYSVLFPRQEVRSCIFLDRHLLHSKDQVDYDKNQDKAT